MDRENPWGKDGTSKDVELHLYRSMIRSLMYLTTSRPDIMFAVYPCARHQVTPKECHLHAVKRIFRYLKGYPKLGLWYPKESPFDLVAYSDNDYGGANQDRKSTTGGCQFLGRRLISWQCKKQTIMATSTTRAEYVATASGCGQPPLATPPLPPSLPSFFLPPQIVDFLEASHIRVETVDGETNIIAKVNGKQRTVSESSIRRHIKLNDEEAHYESTQQEDQTTSLEPIQPDIIIPSPSHSDISTPRRLTRGTIQISQSKVPLPGADETASPTRDDRHREAFPTATSLDAW
ncbi:hypothetical protein Tco_0215634 [Tanacetum coccineum]